MNYENIIFEKEENVGIIKLNRPKALNAINPAMRGELNHVLDKIESDNSVRALILTGEGEKAFAAGADVAHMAELSPLQMRRSSRDGNELCFRLENLPIPVIAAVNGFALGGGAELAVACDFVYASENARFGMPEITLGIIPGYGGTQRLPRLVGKAMAKEMCMTGVFISANEAKEIGLVNRVFSSEVLLEEAMKTAKKMASMGRFSIRAVKKCINDGVEVDLKSGCHMESDSFGFCMVSPDGKEGMSAFLEKRKPEFMGDLD